jgi:hypothetical protein
LPLKISESGRLVSDRSREALLPLISNYIRAGSIIISDQWGAYWTVTNEGIQNLETLLPAMNYRHFSINHSVSFVDQNVPEIHTNTIEGIWSAKFKNYMKPMKGIQRNELQSYIDEFIIRSWCAENVHHDERFEIFQTNMMTLMKLVLTQEMNHENRIE